MKKSHRKGYHQKKYFEELEEVKKGVMISMFADDDLMNRLVLKGGNALDLVYRIGHRGSMDFDFSIEDEFSAEEQKLMKVKFERALNRIFNEKGYMAFDVKFREALQDKEVANFW